MCSSTILRTSPIFRTSQTIKCWCSRYQIMMYWNHHFLVDFTFAYWGYLAITLLVIVVIIEGSWLISACLCVCVCLRESEREYAYTVNAVSRALIISCGASHCTHQQDSFQIVDKRHRIRDTFLAYLTKFQVCFAVFFLMKIYSVCLLAKVHIKEATCGSWVIIWPGFVSVLFGWKTLIYGWLLCSLSNAFLISVQTQCLHEMMKISVSPLRPWAKEPSWGMEVV